LIKVISNSTPIISLSIMKSLDLLLESFEVIIPREVYNEVVIYSNEGISGKLELENAVKRGSIIIYDIEDTYFVDKTYGHFHRGELEVIVAAKELKNLFVLIDERSCRRFAEDLMLKTIGTIGILKMAKLNGEIKEVRPLLDKLIARKIRISEKLYLDTLKELNEL